MINTDSKLLEALQSSTCFGLAHDESVPECKQCDVKAQCKAKSEGSNIPIPKVKAKTTPTEAPKPATTTPKKDTSKSTKPKTEAKTKKAEPKPKASNTLPGNLPAFKDMTMEDLQALATERNVEWKEYGNANITRMRLIMNLKESYK